MTQPPNAPVTLPGTLKNSVIGLADRLSHALLRWAIRRGRANTARRYARGIPASVWGVTPILTLPLKAECDRRLGFRAETIVWQTYRITQDFTLNLRRVAGLTGRISPRLLPAMSRAILALALLRYDVFHYFHDRGLLWPNERFGLQKDELEALKAAGKKVLVFAYGADVRTRARTLALGPLNFCRDCPEIGAFCICDDAAAGRKFADTAELADAVVTMADMGAYPKGARHCDYWPIDMARITLPPPRHIDGPLVVGHAPNHSHFKGTRYLEAAIASLAAQGKAIELRVISGVTNKDVLAFYSQVDVVADQFLGGAFGYAALEAMALGKPVLSYVREGTALDGQEDCPVLQCPQDRIEAVLDWCLANRLHLPQIGLQGHIFVARHHSIPAVTARFARLYREIGAEPEGLRGKWDALLAAEPGRKTSVPEITGWQHPFRIPGP